MRASTGCTGSGIAVADARAHLDQVAGARRVDLDADRGGLDERVEVAAEGHVVGHLARRRRRPRPGRARAGRPGRCGSSRPRRGRRDTATRASTRPAGVSRRTTVSGSRTSTMPVSTRTVATPIVPWPHIGRQPETSMKSTPQSASSRVGGCRIAPDIARVAARLAHEQQAQVVALGLEAQLALEHRRPGQRPDAAGDDARRHALGVGVDGGEVARRPQAGDRRRRSAASAVAQRGALVVVERQARRARRAAGEADLVHRRLEVLHELGRHVEAPERQQPAVDLARGVELARRGSARRARRTRAGATSATPDDPAGGAGAEALERPVVAADEDLEVGRVQQRRDAAHVARALLDRDDLLVAPRRCGR